MRDRNSALTHSVSPSQIALYAFPLGWLALFFVSLLKFNISYVAERTVKKHADVIIRSFLPIVILALVFNFSNVLGFT